MRLAIRTGPSALACTAILATLLPAVPAEGAGFSLRFHGTGEGDVDRVKIRVDDPANPADEPGPPVDVGATDFTIEFWVRGSVAENAAPAVPCGASDNWILGNVLLDRDRWEPGGRDWGVSIGAGRVAFGVTNDAFDARTICGASNVLDGEWHHVAVQRRSADGFLWIWVDGQADASGDGPDGDVSYPGNETPGGTNCGGAPCLQSDPFLVIGAEKHDAGPAFPSFSGWVDEIRVSTVLRYVAPFAPPVAPFATDAATAALYHLDEGAADVIGDASGAPGGPSPGERRFGGSPLPGPEWSEETPFGPPATAAVSLPRSAAATLEAYPNPALGQTFVFVRSAREREGPIRVDVHDVRGRGVASLAGELRGGSAVIVWEARGSDGKPATPGVYFLRLASEPGVVTKVVLR